MPKLLSEFFRQDINVWYYRADNILRHVLTTQAGAALRHLEPLNFWRFRKDKSHFDEVRRESLPHLRFYEGPSIIRLHIDHAGADKPLEKAGVDNTQTHTLGIDLAECIRIGELFQTTDPGLDFFFYLPQPGDVYQWNFSLYQIDDFANNAYFHPLRRYVTWKGQAKLFRTDSTDPNTPLVTESQPKVEQPVWP